MTWDEQRLLGQEVSDELRELQRLLERNEMGRVVELNEPARARPCGLGHGAVSIAAVGERSRRHLCVGRFRERCLTARELGLGTKAEAFRAMGRQQFLREFPRHAKAVERLEEAIEYAEKSFAEATDRQRFIAQARNRLAERITEGRYASQRSPARER